MERIRLEENDEDLECETGDCCIYLLVLLEVLVLFVVVLVVLVLLVALEG